MARLIRARSVQPSSRAAINWSDPITRGLIFAWTHLANVDHVRGLSPTVRGTGAEFNPATGYVANTGGGLDFGANAGKPTGAGVGILVGATIQDDNNCSLFTRMAGSSDGYATDWLLDVLWGSLRFEVGTANGNEGPSTSMSGVPVNTPITIAATFTPSPNNSSGRLYINGELRVDAGPFYGARTAPRSQATVITTIGSADGTDYVRPYINTSSARGIRYAYAWDRPPTHDEIKRLHANPWLVFVGASQFIGEVGGTPQLLRPASDVSDGDWLASSGSDLFSMLDETTADDADYIYTETAGATCTVELQVGTDPAVSTGHILRYRLRGDGASGILVELLQNTTVIASWTHDPAPSSFTDYQQTLSGAQADSITNYGALRLRFTEV